MDGHCEMYCVWSLQLHLRQLNCFTPTVDSINAWKVPGHCNKLELSMFKPPTAIPTNEPSLPVFPNEVEIRKRVPAFRLAVPVEYSSLTMPTSLA
jgi:hypothetical protein